jgi:hypothetical protein
VLFREARLPEVVLFAVPILKDLPRIDTDSQSTPEVMYQLSSRSPPDMV